MNRREIMKHLGFAPIAASLIASESMFGSAFENHSPVIARPLLTGDKNIYNNLGVETIINCRGTFTILG